MIYYISDTHFGHSNVIKMSNRPFSNVEEMNNQLIKNWNNIITNNDIVYFLGDFSFLNKEKSIQILEQLKGKKYFIKGNHDKTNWLNIIKALGLIIDWFDYKEISDKGRKVILCHYPLCSWNSQYRGSYHLYGHTHNKVLLNDEFQKNRFNVCVENIGYNPITLDELIEKTFN